MSHENSVSVYELPLRRTFKAKKNKSNNQSLPSINVDDDAKFNSIYKQHNNIKLQLLSLKAKIHHLKAKKLKVDSQKQKKLMNISAYQQVCTRIEETSVNKIKYKIEQENKKKQSKYKVQQLKHMLSTMNKNQQQQMKKLRLNRAGEGRQVHQHYEDRVRRCREEEFIKKRKKAEKVKEQEERIRNHLEEYKNFRIISSQTNYKYKVMECIRAKQYAQLRLTKLKQQENQALEQLQESRIALKQALKTPKNHKSEGEDEKSNFEIKQVKDPEQLNSERKQNDQYQQEFDL